VLITNQAQRLGSYNVWDYAEGQDSYQRSMLVDLTQPPGNVSDVLLFYLVNLYRNVLEFIAAMC